MYKVFVNNGILKIVNKLEPNFDLVVNYKGEIQLLSLVELLENNIHKEILILVEDTGRVLDDFAKISNIRVAAGGKVKNPQDEVLFIYRDGVWDLPKGFVEKGEKKKEGAVREVEEETGVTGLEIANKEKVTYHTYRYKGKLVLKISHWYSMTTNFSGKLTPQLNEGITKVEWLNETQINNALENTWENIKLLF